MAAFDPRTCTFFLVKEYVGLSLSHTHLLFYAGTQAARLPQDHVVQHLSALYLIDSPPMHPLGPPPQHGASLWPPNEAHGGP